MKPKPVLVALAITIGSAALCVTLLPSRSNAQAVKVLKVPAAEQYKVVGLADDDPSSLEAKLNKLAAEGWNVRVSFAGDQFRGLILAK